MQITCERCETVYELDDALIPASGAPVQCTRCGLVFTARPPPRSCAAAPLSRPTAPPPGAPPSAPPSSPASPAAPEPSPAATVLFGAASQAGGAASGLPRPAQPVPPLAEARQAVESPAATVLFGAAKVPAPPEPRASPSPAVPITSFPKERPSPARPAPAERDTSTPAWAGTSQPGPARPTVEPSPNATVLFGSAQAAGAEAPAPTRSSAPVIGGRAPPVVRRPGESANGRSGLPDAQPAARAATQPSAASSSSPPSAEAGRLASSATWTAGGVSSPEPAPAPSRAAPAKVSATGATAVSRPKAARQAPASKKGASETLAFEQALRRRHRLGPILAFSALGLVVVAVLAALLLRNHVPDLDPAIAAEDKAALELLAQDDTESLKKALAAWEALSKKAPDYVPAVANPILAEVLLVCDLRDELRRLDAQRVQLEKEMRRLEERQPQGFEARVEELREQLKKLKSVADPLADEASQRDDHAGALLKASRALSDRTRTEIEAVHRASAVYYASKMNDNAERLAERYRRAPDARQAMHDAPRAWADLALALLHAQPRISQEKRDKGLAFVLEAKKKNPRLLRLWLLEAKLKLTGKDYAGAKKAVADLLAANPAHTAARRLLADIEAAEAPARTASSEG